MLKVDLVLLKSIISAVTNAIQLFNNNNDNDDNDDDDDDDNDDNNNIKDNNGYIKSHILSLQCVSLGPTNKKL